jgi:hypothetical protein
MAAIRRSWLAGAVAVAEVLLQLGQARLDPARDNQLHRVLGPLLPGAQQLIGGEDPHLRLGGHEGGAQRRAVFLDQSAHQLVLKLVQEDVDHAEIGRLHPEEGIVEQRRTAQGMGQAARIDTSEPPAG